MKAVQVAPFNWPRPGAREAAKASRSGGLKDYLGMQVPQAKTGKDGP